MERVDPMPSLHDNTSTPTTKAEHQRAAKYRAWDRKLKKFIYHELAVGQVGLLVTSDDDTPLHLFENLEAWQQYTGHLSIDGVEVCDGDLLRSPGHTKLFRVGWNNHEGEWGLFYEGVRCFGIRMAQFMQIVGHVHNKPELKSKT